MSFLWSLGSFLIAISVLVAVHEYGHFWAARKCGVKVHRFSIGFGKVLWRRTDKQGTEFALSMIPLGGYVKMLDGRAEDVPLSLKSQAFDQKSVLQRAFIIAAGPLANFIFAIIAYWIIYSVGMPSVKPVIESVAPNSIAAQAKIEANSQIITIDGQDAPDWETINMLLAAKLGESQVDIGFSSFGSNVTYEKRLDLSDWRFDPEKESAFESLGMNPVRAKIEMTLSKVVDNSPAQKAGLQVGDKILNKNLTALSWQDFVKLVELGRPIPLKIERDGNIFDKMVQPEKNTENRWFVGISPTFLNIGEQYRTELKYGILDALSKGVEKTAQLSWLTVKVMGKLFTGDLSLNNLSGPISIAKGAGASSSVGWVYFLSFMALISVNLGIMNLFPLPVLDGGHLVFLAAEGIKGKPVSEQVQHLSYRIGAALLLTLMVFALFNDFLRL
ncbi:sigma E protease regulator RseP [Rodentibacter pneumotropicus]|uniref:sigma E protease regulator RseP n=1 Tax=Rodentibacter pneumotropicus TaxID=758 RepID=UPI000364499F|nr:sigma E protease regulator RseP [Rodentibacter pneumotropicus]NBH76317.1 sigma E protease regulator RseP [Rodentibacter pneumotropicus]OOF64843.1 RIP metalloprotease RseP [Rodentibacter pneumotropicus]THA03622.1 sigma E protease regulator RseP [Rodentibacter pneumotropicus]THA07618.1 sigma E protease regulator RseP [Rodentibacter pneumotropicus]THA10862.1 sigma E protease regulator RseP [Rodentibacter pneumotropicus]